MPINNCNPNQYCPDPRGQLCRALHDKSFRYYICLVDIPNAWLPKPPESLRFEQGFIGINNYLVYKVNIDFPGTSPYYPGDSYATYLLPPRSEEHTSELQSLRHLVCRL